MSVTIQYSRQTIELARQHARSHYSVEVCGLCFGCVLQTQEDGWLVSVEEFWPAPYANHSYASVSFTPQSWVAALDHLDHLREQTPEHGWRIVGWYHSHPGFGIFFSGVDRHSHVTYFQQPWHVALVIDPRSGKEGWFGHSVQGEIQRFGLEAICEMPEQPPIPAPTLEAEPGTEEVST